MHQNRDRALRTAITLVLAGAGTLTGAVASAQQAARTDAQLEDIVVTARKTTETLQEAPVTVAAFTAEQIEDRQLRSVDDVARFAPGLVFDKAFGRTTDRPVIRGQGNVLAGVQAGVEAGAAYFVDGIYYPGDIQSFDFNEVERVEVIKGPQSALYGRNTYSGAINYVTRNPSDTFRATGRGSIDQDEQAASLRLEGPISDTLRASLSLRHTKFDGQWKNEVTGKDIGQERTQQVAGVLQWRPVEDFGFKLRASYTKDRDGTRPFWFSAPDQNNCFPGTRSLSSYAITNTNPQINNPYQYFCGELKIRKIYANDGASQFTSLPIEPSVPVGTITGVPAATLYNPGPGIAFSGLERDSRYFSGIADWDIAGSGYTLTVDGGLRVEGRRTGSDSDFTSVNNLSAANRALGAEAAGANTSADHFRDWSAEARIASPTDRDLRFLLGLYQYKQTQELSDINFFAPKGMYVPFQVSNVDNQAAFGLVEWKFATDWSITVEGRYAKEKKRFREWATTNTGIGAQTFNSEGEWKKFTPRATVKWQATPDLNLYAIYAEGVKPGGFNGAAGIPFGKATYEQETSKNYELGAKSAWLDGRLTANLAVYYIDSKQIQLTQAITSSASPNAVTSLVTNQGAGDVKGAEVDLRWKATDYLTLGATFSLSDSSFKQGCDDMQWTLTSGGGRYIVPANGALTGTGFTAPIDGCPGSNVATNLNGQGNPSIKGKRFPLSARETASLSADWVSPLGGTGMDFYANVGASYTGKRYVQVHNLAYVGAATVVDARIGVEKDRWTAGLYARNLTQEDAASIATRWFSSSYIGASTAPIPGLAQLKAPLPVATTFGSYSLPRGFFGSFRRERQIGFETSFRFGGDKPVAAPAAAPLAAAPAPAPAPAPPPDSDGDGVLDSADQCPGTPAGAKVDARGCELDADADGVVDRLDRCPATPAGAKVDANGCEVEAIVLKGVLFDTNRATLKPESVATLDAVVETLKKRAGSKVEIAGYTDSRGAAKLNQKLSEARAQAVVDYLVSKGIPAGDLSAAGYGAADPIATNDTPEGREQNRRVTLRFKELVAK